MASRCSSQFVMSLVIILLAVDYSSANCDQGNLGREMEKDVFLQSNTRFLLGRKMLQEMDGKPASLDSSFPEVEKKISYSHAQQASMSGMTKKDGAEAFLEADDEVANLMRKDYRGIARRRPPINNHEPNN